MATRIGNYEIPDNALLGQGQFGKVKAAVHVETGARVACKILDKAKIKTKKDVETVKKEVKVMKELNGHPNILNMLDMLEDSSSLYLVLELAAGGDLFDKIVSVGGFDEPGARHFFLQILAGLEYCHSKGVIHRDMKPENLLLGDKEVLKISDFGLSNIISSREQLLGTHCGSEKYAAPEVMQTTDAYRGPPVDIWSCGVILYIMVGGSFPFVEATRRCDLYTALEEGRFQYPKHFSGELIDLLSKMFAIKPEERITLDQMKTHPWITQGQPIPTPAEPTFAEDDVMMAEMNEEPVYRSLDADMMNCDQIGFEEEPVFRSIDMATEASPVSSAPVEEKCNALGFACKSSSMTTSMDASKALATVAEVMRSNGANVACIENEDKTPGGIIEATTEGSSPDKPLQVCVMFQADSAGVTHLNIKRMQGHCLDYVNLHTKLLPLLKGAGLGDLS